MMKWLFCPAAQGAPRQPFAPHSRPLALASLLAPAPPLAPMPSACAHACAVHILPFHLLPQMRCEPSSAFVPPATLRDPHPGCITMEVHPFGKASSVSNRCELTVQMHPPRTRCIRPEQLNLLAPASSSALCEEPASPSCTLLGLGSSVCTRV